MAESTRLAAHRAAALAAGGSETEEIPKPVPPAEDDETDESKPKEPPMADENDNKAAVDAARTEGHSAGFKAANDRMSAVMGSEHYAGRETLAKTLLANEKMTAEDITTALAAAPKAAAPDNPALSAEEQRAAAEEAGREEMKGALADTKNSNIDPGAGGGGKPDAAAEATAFWDRVHAQTFGSN